VGIVQLDHDLFRKQPQVVMILFETVNDIVNCCRCQKIFLFETQFPPLLNIVGRIKNFGDIFRHHLFFKRPDIIAFVEEFQIKFPRSLGAPETQGVDRVRPVTGNGGVMGHGHDIFGVNPVVIKPAGFIPGLGDFAVKPDLMKVLRPVQFPRVGIAQPVVGNLYLGAVNNFLSEDAVLITDAVAVRRNRHGRHRVKKTGGQSSQTAVTKPGILLLGKNLGEIMAERFHGVTEIIQQSQIQQRVFQRTPHQKFQRDVIDPLGVFIVICLLRVHPAGYHPLSYRVGKGDVDITFQGRISVLAEGIFHMLKEGLDNLHGSIKIGSCLLEVFSIGAHAVLMLT